MKSADHTANTGAEPASRVVRTFGEIFPDGSVLELVAPAVGDQPDLLLWNATKISIAPEIEHLGQLYRPEKLHCSIMRATRFPREPLSYGTIRQIFTELAGTFEEYLAFSKTAAERTALWVLATWFSDRLSSPPALWISGADMGRAASFFGLLHCLCRRPLKVAGITRAGFLSLPMSFRPTLLVNQPSLSAGMRNFWHESNYRDLVVPGNGGTVRDVSCSKAIFTGMAGAELSSSAENLHLTLFPADREAPPLDEHTLTVTADYFLPRLLQYRLDQAHIVQESPFAAGELKFPTRELAGNLGACIKGDMELALRVVPLLLPQDDAVGLCNLDCAIIEVLWPRLHSPSPEAAALTRMKIEAELTADVNTYLLSCGETVQYTREEVGIRVASLEFSKKRMGAGSVLLLNRETSRRVHHLARCYGIERNVPECTDCQRMKTHAE